MMNVLSEALRCEALAGLALLFAFSVSAEEPLRDSVRQQLRDENYVLVEDDNGARLFVFSTGSVSAVTALQSEDRSSRESDHALEMTRSVDARTRVRGLTLLSGVDDIAALDAAMVLLADPVIAVREEAVQLIIEHPDADFDTIVALAANDPSDRVRQVAAELIEERLDDLGD
jgi:hypothetical protein